MNPLKMKSSFLRQSLTINQPSINTDIQGSSGIQQRDRSSQQGLSNESDRK